MFSCLVLSSSLFSSSLIKNTPIFCYFCLLFFMFVEGFVLGATIKSISMFSYISRVFEILIYTEQDSLWIYFVYYLTTFAYRKQFVVVIRTFKAKKPLYFFLPWHVCFLGNTVAVIPSLMTYAISKLIYWSSLMFSLIFEPVLSFFMFCSGFKKGYLYNLKHVDTTHIQYNIFKSCFSLKSLYKVIFILPPWKTRNMGIFYSILLHEKVF